MSLPDSSNEPRDTQTLAEIRGAIESLRAVYQVAALSGIVLGAAVFLFLYKEVALIRRQNTDLKNFIADYNTNLVPKVELSRTNLEAFARTNPSFAPLYKKYFTTNSEPAQP